MPAEIIHSNESSKLLRQQRLFEISLLCFHFFSTLQYLDCYYNEYPLKQTAFLYLKSLLEPVFTAVCFCYFW